MKLTNILLNKFKWKQNINKNICILLNQKKYYSIQRQLYNNENNINLNNDNNNNGLTIDEINEMIINPDKYVAEKLKPYFRRIPREGYAMHGHVLVWYMFAGFSILLWTSFVTVWIIDHYIKNEERNYNKNIKQDTTTTTTTTQEQNQSINNDKNTLTQ